MQLHPSRAEYGVIAGQTRGTDGRTNEHQRRTLHVGWQTTHTGLSESPVDDGRGLTSRLGNFEWASEFADQQFRVIDLDGGKGERKLELKCGRALELQTRAIATHLEEK